VNRQVEPIIYQTILVFSIFSSSVGMAGVSKTFRTGSSKSSCNDQDRADFVEILNGAKLIQQIPCQSNCNSTEKCYPFKLSQGGFILVDNVPHDGVLQDSLLSKYSDAGEIDKNFRPPFASNWNELRNDKPRIKSISKIAETDPNKGLIEVTGDFQLHEIDGLSDFERSFCIGEDCVGFDGWASNASLTFNSRGEIVSKQILKKAVVLYTRKQIIQELNSRILGIEGHAKKGELDPHEKQTLEKYKRELEEINKNVSDRQSPF